MSEAVESKPKRPKKVKTALEWQVWENDVLVATFANENKARWHANTSCGEGARVHQHP